ncbi:hypothetical protein KIN20_028800 [Parelaphostrongylus tenuis]|uniref:Uncharacterized protein n=1 Tax=Parelaphostrongylus tenuis TaxID=148309 RepID=A0AAD5WF35_PARTN|nr:hypothetical protein KIN20_028800 [Parelaphostrongylus tenuis]
MLTVTHLKCCGGVGRGIETGGIELEKRLRLRKLRKNLSHCELFDGDRYKRVVRIVSVRERNNVYQKEKTERSQMSETLESNSVRIMAAPQTVATTEPGLKIAAVDVPSTDQNEKRTRDGKWTLRQLRQTDAIVPLQSGTNKFDSQRLPQSKGSRFISKITRMWHFEDPVV